MPDQANLGKVTPIMGPGCGNKALEDCPPAFHVELTADELIEAIRDPQGAAKRLGMERLDSVHVDMKEPKAGPRPGGGATPQSQTIYCCVKCLSSSLCCQAWPA